MRVDFSGLDPSVVSRSADPSTITSPLDEERRRQQAGVTGGPDAGGIGSARVTLSPEGLALLKASRPPGAADETSATAAATQVAAAPLAQESVSASAQRGDTASATRSAGVNGDQTERPSLRAAEQRLASSGIRAATDRPAAD